MNSLSVDWGHIINAARQLSEKLIIIWKLALSSRALSSHSICLFPLSFLLFYFFSRISLSHFFFHYFYVWKLTTRAAVFRRGKSFLDADARAKRASATGHVFHVTAHVVRSRARCSLSKYFAGRKISFMRDKTISSSGQIYLRAWPSTGTSQWEISRNLSSGIDLALDSLYVFNASYMRALTCYYM